MNFIEQLKNMEPIPYDVINWCEKYNITTLEEMWKKGERGDWMLWVYARLYPDNIREIFLAKGHCANTVRFLMKDNRSRNAVDAAIAFGEGKITFEELDDAHHAAYVAAVDADNVYDDNISVYDAAAAAAYYTDDVDVNAHEAFQTVYHTTRTLESDDNYVFVLRHQLDTADICRKYLKL